MTRFRLLPALIFAIVMMVFPLDPAHGGLYENAMSMDTTPVNIEMAGARYYIPRNYLYNMDNWNGGPQEGVSIRVVYPGFKPFNPETRNCMLKLNGSHCRIYEVYVVDKFPASEDGEFNREQMMHPEKGRSGPFGFRLFSTGSETARTEFYRKEIDKKPIIFTCFVQGKIDLAAVCHHVAHTSTGATISYFFGRNDELEDAVEVDLGLRKLIDSFYQGKA